MKSNIFFTIFWTLYFPSCLAFYAILGFDYIDEVLTLILILYTLASGALWRKDNNYIFKESLIFIGLISFYIVYSLMMAVNVEKSVWLDLIQQVRPYAVLYCTWMLNPKFTEGQKKYLLRMMLVIILLYAFFWFSGMVNVTMTGKNTREDVVIGQMSLITAICWYLWKPRNMENTIFAIAICGIGLLGGKSKFFGELVVFVGLTYFLKSRINLNNAKSIVQFVLLTIVVLFFTWSKFSKYYVDGFDASSELYGKQARPETYKTAVTIAFQDYVPFGSGMGTFATNAAAVYYSPLYYKYKMDRIWGLYPQNPMFVADAFYPVLAEFGIVGIFFFLAFWRRRLKAVLKIPETRAYRMGLMCILALALESVADSSYLSGKGMGYFMLLAICLNSIRNIPKKTT